MLLNTDTSPEVDLLDRKSLAKRIATGLMKTAQADVNGFVTALTGRWGSGKSTLLAYIKEELKKKWESDVFLLVEFNPWMFSDATDIKKTFLAELLNQVRPKRKTWIKKWLKGIRSFLFNFRKPVEEFVPYSKMVGPTISSLLEQYLKEDGSLSLKKKIDAELVKNKKKLFVFIDDIDRLYPKQVFELLQVLKLTAGFKNTYYVIAYDREAVELSIESQFQDYGKKYLDKIVQVDFSIPEAADEKLETVFFNELEKFCKQYRISYNSSSFSSLWLHYGVRTYFTTLRDVYRYFNSLQFTLTSISEEVNVTDFLLLEALRLHDFDAYQRLYFDYYHATFVIGGNGGFPTPEFLGYVTHPATRKVLDYLFRQNVVGSFSGNAGGKRLYDPQNFKSYFTLQIGENDIAEVEFRRFIEMSQGRKDMLYNIFKLGRLENLLLRLTDGNLFQFFKQWDFTLIEDLYQFLNESAYMDTGLHHRLSAAIINLLAVNSKSQNEYFHGFLELLLQEDKEVNYAKIYYLHYLLLSKEQDNNFPGSSYDSFKEFYLGHYDRLKDHYLLCLRNWADYFLGRGIRKPLSFFTLLFIYDFATWHSLNYLERIDGLLKGENNLLFFLRFTLEMQEGEVFSVNMERLNVLLPFKDLQLKFAEGVKHMDITKLTEEQQKWRDAALTYFNDEYFERKFV